MSRVRVSHLQASGLRAADSNGSSDPFAVMTCGSESWTTETIKNTLRPSWTKPHTFGSKCNVEALRGIEVHLFDWDVIGSNDILGDAFIPFDAIWEKPDEEVLVKVPVTYEGAPAGRCEAALSMFSKSVAMC
jgi:Ca2+-dependent lipid-binding protein